MVTLTSQILGTFSHLPAESVDLNPGHLLAETARLTPELALTFITASQVLSASFLLLQHSQAFPSSVTALVPDIRNTGQSWLAYRPEVLLALWRQAPTGETAFYFQSIQGAQGPPP